ncbi:hypothetical protein C2U55_11010 [Enterobacteriaceae bacterium ENNIH3]|nr:hypothetical protein C2U55_11010 [Enterobacteriaceae bacterium ENNIH3]AUV10377.1 hypothetical protein C2U52_31100 [Enterobacteriaceae bacterium ENNIH2]PWF51954.1 hypothetical protein BHT19_0013830 [[Kluyvera] intestini]
MQTHPGASPGGADAYPFTCPEVPFHHEHTVNGTHLPSRIFPLTLALSLREREPIVLAFFMGIPPLYDRAPNP